MLASPRKAHMRTCFWRRLSPGLLYTSPYRCSLHSVLLLSAHHNESLLGAHRLLAVHLTVQVPAQACTVSPGE